MTILCKATEQYCIVVMLVPLLKPRRVLTILWKDTEQKFAVLLVVLLDTLFFLVWTKNSWKGIEHNPLMWYNSLKYFFLTNDFAVF